MENKNNNNLKSHSKKNNHYKPGKYYLNIKKKNIIKYEELIKREKHRKISYFLLFIISNIMTIYNLCLYIIETYITLKEDDKIKLSQYIKIQNLICGLYFIIEYILILFSKPENSRLKYFFSNESIFDIITSLPSFVIYFTNKFNLFSFFRVIKTFRCLRILRTMYYFQIIYRENFDNKYKIDFIYIIIVFLSTFIIAGGLLVFLNDFTENAFNIENIHFFDGLYVFFVTATTLGYGDIYPTNFFSRFSIICLIIIFVSITSKEISNAIQIFDNMKQYKSYNYKEHIIIIANCYINIFDVLYELRRKYLNKRIIVLSNYFSSFPSFEFPYNKVNIVNSKIIDYEILERINTKFASCIFVFIKKILENEKLEKEKEFLLLKITQFYPKVPIYIQNITNSKNSNLENKYNNNQYIKNLFSLSDLKSIIFSTSIKNIGYLTFIQNLIFNYYTHQTKLLNEFDILMKSYFYGSENKIVVEKLPSYFIGFSFYDSMRIIYSKSISNYFEKIMVSKVINEIKPILLIGIYQDENDNDDKIFFLNNHIEINNNSYGIFISYNKNQYVKNILSTFNKIIPLRRVKTIKKDINIYNNKINNAKRRNGIFITENNNNNNSHLNEIKKEIFNNDEKEISEKIKFYKRKENMLTGGKNFSIKSTSNNLLFINNFYDLELDEVIGKIQTMIKNNKFTYNETICDKIDIESRIYDSSKNEISSIFSNHIIIFGYQEGLKNIIKHIKNYFSNNAICIFIDKKENEKVIKIKDTILKFFEQVYLIYGDMTNPKNLYNCSLQKSIFCLLLISTINENINDDLKNILCYRIIQKYFQTKTIIEVWNNSSLKFLGYTPFISINEFFHPLFISGKIFLLEHFDKLLPKLYLNEKKTKAWIEFVKLGNNKIIDNKTINSNNNIYLLSIDIPEIYIGKDFFSMFCDFICLENPIVILGLYINDTEEYQIKKKGFDIIIQENISTNEKIFGNYNYRKLKFQEKNLYYIKKMIERSLNGKSNSDCVDITHPYLPVFITNPPPWFILPKKTSILILYNFDENKSNFIFEFQKNLLEKIQRRQKKFSTVNKRLNIRERQSHFFNAIYGLKEKMKEKYINEFREVV